MKHWKLIVTHNPNGEYGHIHHKMISKLTTDIYNDKIDKDITLYYFGKYYSKKYLKNHNINEPEISIENYDLKCKILKKYYSQSFINEKYDQMFKYEAWINVKDWS
jgi:LmbE family N-acetylglucosaminyl deacetylase